MITKYELIFPPARGISEKEINIIIALSKVPPADPEAQFNITFTKKKLKKWSNNKWADELGYFIFTCRTNLRPEYISYTDEPIHSSEKEDKQFISTYLTKEIFDLILALNIAMPGILGIVEGVIYIDDIKHEEIGNFLNDFYGIYNIHYKGQERNWPPIEELDVSSIIEWFRSIPGIDEGVSQTPLGRSVVSYSHLFFRDNMQWHPFLDGLLSILALESLYGISSDIGVRAALIERTMAFLGEPCSEIKKMLGKMYDYRSRFLHGNINFPLSYSQFDGVPGYKEFAIESTTYAYFAQRILLATLQKMGKEKRYEIKFRTEVDVPGIADGD